MVVRGCFWHLLPWDSGAFVVTISGLIKKGPGTGLPLDHWCFLSPTSLSATGGALVFPPGLKFRIYWLYLICNQIICFESYEQAPHPPAWGWKMTFKEPDDLLAKPTSPGPHARCISGTQKRNAALWLLGRGGILLWL